MNRLSFQDISFEIAEKLLHGDVPPAELRRIIDDALTFDAPLVQLDEQMFGLELFHGPTLAFKDIAMQLVARLMDRAQTKRKTRATVVGATSGDTGGAAIEAFRLGQTVLRQEDAGPSVQRRDRRRDYLGLPMVVSGRRVGGLTFGRFGGPSYPAEHIRLAEFVGWHVGQLLENRRMARRIASLEAQRQLARMQDEFVSTVSHELRTPLGFIKGYVTTLLREDTDWDDGTRSQFLTIIDDESDRLCELIDNLLDSSRLETGTLRMTYAPTSLSPIMNDVVQRTMAIHPGMLLIVESDDEIPEIEMDGTRIAQVLENLINNAIKYAPESQVTLQVLNEGIRLRVNVIDKGPGIPTEHISNLFERFYRVPETSTSVRGTGLGLYICRKIIEAHGGEIGVESKPGQGAKFHFTLPIIANIIDSGENEHD